ncbi:hypothetical protein GPALN_001897 [Globodera pallida]|nr:hypothetical protein GPALN_001897 [Globodera pallida]
MGRLHRLRRLFGTLFLSAADLAFCSLTRWGMPLFLTLETLRLSGLADRMMALLDQVEEWSARMGWDSSMVGLVIGADGFVRWAIRNAGGSSVSWDIYFIAQLAELVESPEKVRRWYRTVEGWVRNGRAVMNKMKVRMIGSEGRVKQERESELTFPDEKIE